MKEYISRKEASEIIGFGKRTIDGLIRDGKLQAIKVGSRGVRIKKASLDDLINSSSFYIAPKAPKPDNVKFENASEDDTDMY